MFWKEKDKNTYVDKALITKFILHVTKDELTLFMNRYSTNSIIKYRKTNNMFAVHKLEQ